MLMRHPLTTRQHGLCLPTLWLLISIIGVLPVRAATTTLLASTDGAAMERWVEATMASLTPQQRIGQLMVVAVDPHDNDACRKLVHRYVTEVGVGGIIYNECTAADMVAVTNYAQAQATVPLMMCLDGEWGTGMRIKNTPSYPHNLLLGAIDNDRLLYDYGREVARQMRRAGLHVNFAPVLDVNDNPDNPVIGDRSFGESPEDVARHAVAYARGLEDGAVMSVGKHFPGHGSSTTDSHKTLPRIGKSAAELSTCELVPFRRYIAAGLSAILTAHLDVPALDKSGRPATMSARCITDLLKGKMKFNGLVFTDALVMKGATVNVSGSAAVAALQAGNDILLMPGDAQQEIAAIEQAIAAGILSQADIDSRCRKLLQYKYALGLSKPQHVVPSQLLVDINAASATALQHRLAAATVTVASNHHDVLPLRNLQSKRIAVVTIQGGNASATLFADRCANYAATRRFIATAATAKQVAHTVHNGRFTTVLLLVPDATDASKQALKAFTERCNHLVVVACCAPYQLRKLGALLGDDAVEATVFTYADNDLARDYAAQTIFGGNEAGGNLPVSVMIGKKRLLAGHGIHYKATRLGYTAPEVVGFDRRLTDRVDSVARHGVRAGAYPGCQVLIARHGKVVFQRSYGTTGAPNDDTAITDSTLFDLASVSKAVGTLPAVMKLYDDEKFRLDEAVSRHVPGLRHTEKADLTFRDLLYHETGLPPSLSMWRMMMDTTTYSGQLITNVADDNHTIKIMDGAYGHKDARLRRDILSPVPTDHLNIAIADGLYGGKPTYDSIMWRIYTATTGPRKYVYSCLNFCLLADAVQRISHTPLNIFVSSKIFGPLGAYRTLYRPLTRFSRHDIAATEVDTYLRRQLIHGYAHDELAAFSCGVQGNAALFSCAADIAKLLQMWLNGGAYGGVRFYKPSTVETFTTQHSANSHRGLGFDKPVPGKPSASNTCAEAPDEVFGHTGFTGTCFWVDPVNDMQYVFLSNRVNPTRNNPAFSRVSPRSHIQSIIYQSLTE